MDFFYKTLTSKIVSYKTTLIKLKIKSSYLWENFIGIILIVSNVDQSVFMKVLLITFLFQLKTN